MDLALYLNSHGLTLDIELVIHPAVVELDVDNRLIAKVTILRRLTPTDNRYHITNTRYRLWT